MIKRNPYEDYDAIDPWENDSTLDNNLPQIPSEESVKPLFEAHEDNDIDPIDAIGSDGFGMVEDTFVSSQPPVQSTEAFPKTMVRSNYGEALRGDTAVRSDAPLRRKDRKLKRKQAPSAPAQYAPSPQPQQPYVPQGAARGQAPRQRRPRRRHRFGFLAKLLVFVAIVVGVYWLVAHPIDEKLAFSPSEQQTLSGKLAWEIPGMPYYVLALGSDAREGDTYSRTDTMMLVRVDFLAAKLTLVSIPRDTMVEIEGQGTQKINAAYAFGGAGGAVKAVSRLTGVPINHVAVVHFEELADLVDYLGGVTVNVPVSVYDPEYTGLVLDEGTQTLDGEDALLWARTRYGFTDGDFQRQANQRILLTSLMNRMLSLSPSEMPGALDKMGELIGTDLRCYNLAPLFLRLKLSNPTIYSCSVPATPAEVDGISYVVADEEELARMMEVVNAGGDPSKLE
ncbi:MAG: LCP family protein [Coriobacteriales bacterium]|nr:LCP family protein [Coriobacteriales bacterium]